VASISIRINGHLICLAPCDRLNIEVFTETGGADLGPSKLLIHGGGLRFNASPIEPAITVTGVDGHGLTFFSGPS